MAPAATTAPSSTMNTNWRPVAMIRPSRRWIPTPMVITPRAAAMKPRVTPPKPSAPFTAPSSLGGVHRRRPVLGAVLDHDPVGLERVSLPVPFADHRDPVLEQLGRIAVVEDLHPGCAVRPVEGDPVGRPHRGAVHDGAHQPEAMDPLARALLHRPRDRPAV